MPVSIDHYENFPIASLLCPARLRPAVQALYAYARCADDLADEGDVSASERLAMLDAYEADLHAVAAGRAPSLRWNRVFARLAPVLHGQRLPLQPLTALLSAFRQDVVRHAYADRPLLLDYCRRSADPIGRLMLHLHGIDDAVSLQRSDAICTGLQLANFWQDLSIDTRRGRLYVPSADCLRHGVSPGALLGGQAEPGLAALLADLVAWTRDLLHEGAPLVHRIGGRAGWELRLVVQGGQRILDRVASLGPGVLARRPTLGPADAPRIAWRAVAMRAGRCAAPADKTAGDAA